MMQVLPLYGTSFAAVWHEFCHFMAQVLPPYGTSFAALWLRTKKSLESIS
jgi:hypothetical protein